MSREKENHAKPERAVRIGLWRLMIDNHNFRLLAETSLSPDVQEFYQGLAQETQGAIREAMAEFFSGKTLKEIFPKPNEATKGPRTAF